MMMVASLSRLLQWVGQQRGRGAGPASYASRGLANGMESGMLGKRKRQAGHRIADAFLNRESGHPIGRLEIQCTKGGWM